MSWLKRLVRWIFRPGKLLLIHLSVVSILIGMLIAFVFFSGQPVENPSSLFAVSGAVMEEAPAVRDALTIQSAFREVAKRVSPAVVNISTEQVIRTETQFRSPFEEFFGEDFFEKFFGFPPRREFKQKNLGSGFIYAREGHIVTNNHVVENAKKITVRLADGREFRARIMGKDPKTDLAVLKIDVDGEIPTVTIGDSDRIEVGDWAIAIGNPFGLSGTLTVGVISAKGRSEVGITTYEDFIQTDASINLGNSGGPLLNIRGEVIGINSAILSRTGGSIGIGFAIPVNMAKPVISQLITEGKVTRGWLGVTIQDVTRSIAEYLRIEPESGVLIAEILTGSPAEGGGLKPGDVIIEFNGKRVKNARELQRAVGDTKPGIEARVKIIRKGDGITLKITVGTQPEEKEVAILKEEEQTFLGLTVESLTEPLREKLNLSLREKGVVITGVDMGSPASEAGLRKGDLIKKINEVSISSIADYKRFVGNYGKKDTFLFWVNRSGTSIFIPVKRE